MKKKLLVVALGLSSSLALVSCGSGGDEDTGQVAAPSIFYTVKVIDGYLKNAQVWLDIDGDMQLGSNEPSVLSGGGGVAKLDVTNIVNPEQYSTYAKIIFGQTIDEDSGPVTKSYIMSAPPGEMEITPLSTLVDIAIEQNTDGSETAEQLDFVIQAAIAKVANDFGIQESDVLSDYIASGSGSSAYVAENIVNSQILPDDENEFIVIAGNADGGTFNKQVAAASGMIKAVVAVTAEEDFDIQAAVFDSGGDYDTDSDVDGVPDTLDALDLDASEWLDTDGDTIGNNADPDDDNDGVVDSMDADPLDPAIGQYDDCVVNYVPNGASIDDFNAALAACDVLPEMVYSDSTLTRFTSSYQTRTYAFMADNTADYYRNGVNYNRIWAINGDGNLELYNGEGQPLNYLMRLLDNSSDNLKFAVYDYGSQAIWTTTYQDIDMSINILACEGLDSGWDDINDIPMNYRSYDEFKQTVTSCQDGKPIAAFSTGFIDQGIVLSSSDSQDTYQFNQDGSGVFTYDEGAGDISIPMTWTIYEEGIIKVVLNYTDENVVDQTAHIYLTIAETNGIDFSIKVFTRNTEWHGVDDTALGELSSGVMNVSDIQ